MKVCKDFRIASKPNEKYSKDVLQAGGHPTYHGSP